MRTESLRVTSHTLPSKGKFRRLEALRDWLARHIVAIRDLCVIVGVVLLGTVLAFEFDIYTDKQSVGAPEKTIELDEALTLGAILCLGLLIFSVRRYLEQKKEADLRSEAERHARLLAFQDHLTGVANRRQLDADLKVALETALPSGTQHALFLVDLNGFKQINDIYGHTVGDEVLIVVARRLIAAVREGDLVARVGGDEFAVLSLDVDGAESAGSIALRLMQAFDEPISIGSRNHQISLGVGVTLVGNGVTTPGEALRQADIALYRAKSEVRSAFRLFEAEMDTSIRGAASF